MRLPFHVALIVVGVLAGPGAPANPPAWKDAADQVLRDLTTVGEPGGALGVVAEGQLVYARGFGLANLDHGIPNDADSVFDIASCAKQFTAAAALLLSFDGELDLDADIRRYLPELALQQAVPVRRLMTHTSGIQDYSELQILGRGRDDLHSYRPAEIQAMVYGLTSLAFPPGERELYSNSNYLLLTRIIERVSGRSLQKFCDERIFEPLGMHSTFFREDVRSVVPKRSTGYQVDGKRFLVGLNAHARPLVGAGGLQSTVRDLSRWMANFMNPDSALGGQRLIDELTRPGRLLDGTEIRNANGVMLGRLHNQRWVEHAGHSRVNNALLTWWRDADVATIVLTNRGDLSPWSISNPLLEHLLGSRLVREQQPSSAETDPAKEPDEVRSVEALDLELYVGRYPADLEVGGQRPPHGGVGVLEIRLREGSLGLLFPDGGEFPLLPIDSATLELKGLGIPVRLEFEHLGKKGQLFRFDNPTGHLRAHPLKRLPAAVPERLAAFAGSYAAPELPGGVPIHIVQNGARLFMRYGTRQIEQEVHQVAPDRLTTYSDHMQCNLVFTFDDKGRADGFLYEGHRVWNLRFDRSAND